MLEPQTPVDAIRAGLAAGRPVREIADDLGISMWQANVIMAGAGLRARTFRSKVKNKIGPRMTPAQLLAWRESSGFKQEEAANLLGISRRTYQHYEIGDTRCGMRVRTVPRLVELAIKGLDQELAAVQAQLAHEQPEQHGRHHQDSSVSGGTGQRDGGAPRRDRRNQKPG